ncbi:MAG TPA: hypothetical protein VFE31_13140 [Opitutaceae bacterium]|jgi:hypothetical protein|nr:hypothetical protein [Opitutaceae bacterium]
MAASLPDKLKEELPPGLWGKVLSATPIVMTVVATGLAGLSSNEMNRAQYDRASAAQLQAKASDQWSFFQAKRLRSALQSDVAELLAGEHGRNPDAAPAQRYAFQTASAVPQMPAAVQAALKAEMAGRSDDALDALSAAIPLAAVEAARKLAVERVQQFDAEAARFNAGALDANARLWYASARYDAESGLDEDVAYLYELLVRKSNLEARRHHARSQRFFVGMLLAQAAVIFATFALAARMRHVLWGIAAAAGLVAVLFAAYVYLWT